MKTLSLRLRRLPSIRLGYSRATERVGTYLAPSHGRWALTFPVKNTEPTLKRKLRVEPYTLQVGLSKYGHMCEEAVMRSRRGPFCPQVLVSLTPALRVWTMVSESPCFRNGGFGPAAGSGRKNAVCKTVSMHDDHYVIAPSDLFIRRWIHCTA